jgi:peptidyl-prolyl cis-trans isomerase SurA
MQASIIFTFRQNRIRLINNRYLHMKKIVLLLSLFAIQQSLFAQPKKVIADKIIAQVGDKIILHSDVVNAIADYKRQGQEAELPPNPECAFLEGQLIQKALVLQAEKDSLLVTEEEIDAELDNRIRYFINAYGSKETIEEIYGKTIYQLKDEFRPQIRDKKLADQMRGKIIDVIKITPNEVKIYESKIPVDSLPFYESEIEVSQIVSQPKANKDVEEYVVKQMYEYKRQIESGSKKFETIAKMVSEDPGSKDNGGMYNVNRNDKQWDPTFFQAIFKLKEGQISPVIKSKFGYHIIQMVSRLGDDAVIRHILRIPPITDEEINISIRKLDTVRNNIINGKFNFGEAVSKFSDDETAKFNGGTVTGKDGSTYITIDQLDKDMVIAIKDLTVGQYSKPQVYEDRGVKKVRIVYLKTRTTPHRENIREDYNKIAQRAMEDKKQAALEKWFNNHLPQYYIYIDNSFNNCTSIGEWWKYASNK